MFGRRFLHWEVFGFFLNLRLGVARRSRIFQKYRMTESIFELGVKKLLVRRGRPYLGFVLESLLFWGWLALSGLIISSRPLRLI